MSDIQRKYDELFYKYEIAQKNITILLNKNDVDYMFCAGCGIIVWTNPAPSGTRMYCCNGLCKNCATTLKEIKCDDCGELIRIPEDTLDTDFY